MERGYEVLLPVYDSHGSYILVAGRDLDKKGMVERGAKATVLYLVRCRIISTCKG